MMAVLPTEILSKAIRKGVQFDKDLRVTEIQNYLKFNLDNSKMPNAHKYYIPDFSKMNILKV